MIGIYIPTLNRAHKLEALIKNIHENTQEEHAIYFVCEPEDKETQDILKQCGEKCVISQIPGSHTGAARTIYEQTHEPYFIIANDDFSFQKGWDSAALACMSDTIHVVGINDMGAGNCDTIFLIKRSYIEKQSGCMDMPNVVFYPKYHHSYVDTEFWLTALKRGVCMKCPDAKIEHLHPSFGKAQRDTTYEKADSHVDEDRALFISRQHLWR